MRTSSTTDANAFAAMDRAAVRVALTDNGGYSEPVSTNTDTSDTRAQEVERLKLHPSRRRVLLAVLQDHPALTVEEAVQALHEAGW